MGLFKPAWQSENREKALKAVGKLTDQAALARVVLEAKDLEVCSAAASRLTDQVILADI